MAYHVGNSRFSKVADFLSLTIIQFIWLVVMIFFSPVMRVLQNFRIEKNSFFFWQKKFGKYQFTPWDPKRLYRLMQL